MKTIGITTISILIKVIIFILYLGVRAMKTPFWWVTIPKYKEWQQIEGNEDKTKRFQQDTLQLLITLGVILSLYFVGWWLAVLETLALTTLIIILFIKYLPPGER